MKKKSVLINLSLVIILIFLIVLACFLVRMIKVKKEQEPKDVVLKEIGYKTSVVPVGYRNANRIITNFIDAYNNHDGKGVAQLMNLVGAYIYSGCENKDDFDRVYEEKLSANSDVENLVIMQYSLQRQEQDIIEETNNLDVVLTLIENSEIEDKSKYLSTMTAKIRTVSETDGVDEVDTLEFILLNRDGTYYIMEYNLIASE